MNEVTAAQIEEFRKQYYATQTPKVVAAMEKRAKEGLFNHLAPLGYRNVYDPEKRMKVVAIDEDVAPLIREAFRLASLKTHSLSKILNAVTEKGLVSRSGKPLGRSSLHAILTNPFYAGLVKQGDGLIHGQHEALVKRGLFDSVQLSLSQRNPHPS